LTYGYSKNEDIVDNYLFRQIDRIRLITLKLDQEINLRFLEARKILEMSTPLHFYPDIEMIDKTIGSLK